jgi:hypothetical protein
MMGRLRFVQADCLTPSHQKTYYRARFFRGAMMVIWLVGLLSLVGVSQAADPVLHVGEDPGILLSKAAAASKRPVDDLRVMTFGEMTRSKPSLMLGGGRVESCFGAPSTDASMRSSLERVERALAYMETDKAVAHIQVGEDAIRCLSEPGDAQRIARLAFLKGFVAAEEGDEAAARVAFELAHSVDRNVVWDEDFPPDAKPMFEAVGKEVAERAPRTVRLVPQPSDGVVWIDGQRQVLTDGLMSLTPGKHLVQIPGFKMTTVWVHLRALDPGEANTVAQMDDDTAESEDPTAEEETRAESPPSAQYPTLIVPGAVPDEAVGWVTNPEQHADLDLVLSVLYDPDSMVYFSADGLLVAHPVGSAKWVELTIPAGFGAGRMASRLIAGRSMMWTGAAAVGGGALLATTSWLQAGSAARAAKSAPNWRSFDREEGNYANAANMMNISRWTLLGGVVFAGTGLALQYDNLPIFRKKTQASVVPWANPDSQRSSAGVQVLIRGW